MTISTSRPKSPLTLNRRQALMLGGAGISALALGSFFPKAPALANQHRNLAGHVLDIEGTPMRKNAKGLAPLRKGDAIFINDELTTDFDSRIQLQFEDQSLLNLSNDGRIIIDNFLFTPAKSSGALKIQTLKGAFRFLSGKIAKTKPENVLFKTPVGTIGIRGTHFMALVNEIETNCITLLPQPANDPRQTAIVVSSDMGSVTVDKPFFAADLLSKDQFPTMPKRDPQEAIEKNLQRINGKLKNWPEI